MAYYMYILECADLSLYVGCTSHLQNRARQHQEGRGARHTADRLPVRLVYSELYESKTAAFRRERQVKRWTREKKAALIAGNLQLLQRLSPTPLRRPVHPTPSEKSKGSREAAAPAGLAPLKAGRRDVL
jgi:putative endonuclease